jgi:intergrase/recombinase
MRKITTIKVEESVLNSARAIGLNVSKYVETKLREFLKTQQVSVLGDVDLCGGPDSNRRTPAGTDPKSLGKHSIPRYEEVKSEYLRYLKVKGLNARYIHDLTRDLPRLITSPITDPQEIVELIEKNKYRGALIRNYLNFLFKNQYITKESAEMFKGVIPKRKVGTDNFVPSDDVCKTAFNNLENDRDRTVFKILMFSGIRITEVVKMVSEYNPSKLIVKGNFIKYSLDWDRGNKRVSYVYLPLSMKDELHKFYLTHKIVGSLQKSGLSPKYLRKWFYNFAIYNGVPESVADYIEGRAGSTVGSLHYLARSQQSDFWYQKLVEKLEDILQ